MDTLFALSSFLVMPFWLLMILLPKAVLTRRVIGSPAILIPAAALYAALVLPRIASILPAVANPSLEGLSALLGTPEGALIAWVHFLAFDLAVGRWAYLDSRERGISPWLMMPALLLILLLGPLGFLAYLGVRQTACCTTTAKQTGPAEKEPEYVPLEKDIVHL